MWGLCNPALVRACETHRDYPDVMLRRDLLSLWRLVTRLYTIGTRDNADVDERRKAAEQRFATIKQFQSETTDDFMTSTERFELQATSWYSLLFLVTKLMPE